MKSSNQNYNNFAIRGVVEGIKKVKPSIDFIIKQDKKSDPACGKCQVYDADIRIEPKLFKRYGI